MERDGEVWRSQREDLLVLAEEHLLLRKLRARRWVFKLLMFLQLPELKEELKTCLMEAITQTKEVTKQQLKRMVVPLKLTLLIRVETLITATSQEQFNKDNNNNNNNFRARIFNNSKNQKRISLTL